MPRTHQFLVTLTVHTNKINPTTAPQATSARSMTTAYPVVVIPRDGQHLDRLRRNRVHSCEELDEQAGPASDPTGRLVTALVVERALLGLPVEQRAAVVAVDMQGYTVAETALMLGVAEGTVKSRCSRARAKLAGALDGLAAGATAG